MLLASPDTLCRDFFFVELEPFFNIPQYFFHLLFYFVGIIYIVIIHETENQGLAAVCPEVTAKAVVVA